MLPRTSKFQTDVGCKLVLLISGLLLASVCNAELKPEQVTVHKLKDISNPHRVWVNDMVFNFIADGRSTLIDGDTGDYLGMLSTGLMFLSLTIPSHQKEIYAAQTYFTRAHRGERNDFVAVYDAGSLSPLAEIPIPAKRAVTTPSLHHAVLTDNDQFMLIYNFTPVMSVSVVDVKSRKFIAEVESPGCVMVYPTGPRQFNMLCGDGSVFSVVLDKNGKAVKKNKSEPFFDPMKDPVEEEGVRINNQWLYFSNAGDIYPVDVSSAKPSFPDKWSLLSTVDRKELWLPGGVQPLAVNEKTKRLYIVMHQGGKDSHDDPGKEVWVYDLNSKKRIQRIKTKNLVASIHVSRDSEPLLFTSCPGSPSLDIYDALSGDYLRTVNDLGYSPMVLQSH
jgi:methylamine dehydrogenase heavy chain